MGTAAAAAAAVISPKWYALPPYVLLSTSQLQQAVFLRLMKQ
jgi:hypothetical protein